jgi:hypothetical protein
MSRGFLALLLLGFSAAPAPASDDISWPRLRTHIAALLEAGKAEPALLPRDATRQLAALLERPPKDPDAALQVQQLLDPLCLVVVSINPESRVKAARGAAPAELTRGESRFVLVKVNNDAGITPALRVHGKGLLTTADPAPGCWLEAKIAPPAPLPKALTGERVEYVVLRLTTREVGKREATLEFDAGQGTQDLGFRAEVPILFTIRPDKLDR